MREPTARVCQFVVVLLTSILLASLVAACERGAGPTTTYVELITTGGLRIDWSVPASPIGSGDELVYQVPRGSRVGSDPSPTTITIEQAGITTLTLQQWEQETSSGLGARGWLRKRALFVISAPEGAEITMPFSDAIDPSDVRGTIDYDADGTVDAELTPTASAAEENLEDGSYGRAAVEPRVEHDPTEAASVSFVPTQRSDSVAGIYYAIYPGHPELQFYSEPFVVSEASFILYGAYGEQGQRQPTQEIEVLGGPDDVQMEAMIDGMPMVVEITDPGQKIIITVPGAPSRQVQIDIGPLSGGIQADNQATMEIIGPDGVWLREAGMRSADGLGEEPWSDFLHLNLDGVYTIVIDPRLANVVSTTVTLSHAQ